MRGLLHGPHKLAPSKSTRYREELTSRTVLLAMRKEGAVGSMCRRGAEKGKIPAGSGRP